MIITAMIPFAYVQTASFTEPSRFVTPQVKTCWKQAQYHKRRNLVGRRGEGNLPLPWHVWQLNDSWGVCRWRASILQNSSRAEVHTCAETGFAHPAQDLRFLQRNEH